MDGFGLEEDPAAEFIAREQNNLAGLEEDLNPAKYSQPAEGKLTAFYDIITTS